MTPVEELVELIERVSGIVVPDREMERLLTLGERRAAALGQPNVAAYVRHLAEGRDSEEWRELLARITVNESSLFRGPQQFRALTTRVLPRLVADRPTRTIRVWSAGCARGEEAATLAIVLAESIGLVGWDWRVFASDVSEAVLEEARRARFGRRSTSRLDPKLAERYFLRRDGELELVPELRRRIVFARVNLVRESLALPDAPFDVVFLRNVLIYFRPEAQRRVVERVADNLARDGALFVGPSESLWQLRTPLEPVDLGDCFCYRWPERAVQGAESALRGAERPEPGDARVGGRGADAGAPSPRAVSGELASLLAGGQERRAAGRAVAARREAPDDPALRALEGVCWERARHPERAISAYRAALYLEPTLLDVRFLLAGCLERLGYVDRGRRERRAVLVALSSDSARFVPELAALGAPSLAEIRRQLEAEDG